ncbi:hypothetical protein FQR65_LT00528 [Abscondita terminalis]|nr:hypothetical protein FQR65_LT00528 [Abscondita terminalis]
MNCAFAIACVILMVQMTVAWEREDEICSKKLNIEKSVLEKLIGKLVHETDNETYNKYSECYWKEKKMLREDGTIDWDAVKKKLGVAFFLVEEEFHTAVDECREQKITGKDVGQTVVKNQNCMMKKMFGDSTK